ncbi:hypothetical protein N7490_002605 [Penicillium lividum]|nr:hypothetical protein N7490_002605 [Penicillium lividum]
MASPTSTLQHRSWTSGPYLISTNSSMIPVSILNSWFATEEVYWAKPMPDDVMRETLERSLCFGLYYAVDQQEKVPPGGDFREPEFIGIARCITDFTTFVYLTDVFVLPTHQGHGLGTWLVKCVQEVVESMPYLRRSLLITGDWKRSVPFYKKLMGVEVHENKAPSDGNEGEGLAVMIRKGKGNPNYNEDI